MLMAERVSEGGGLGRQVPRAVGQCTDSTNQPTDKKPPSFRASKAYSHCPLAGLCLFLPPST